MGKMHVTPRHCRDTEREIYFPNKHPMNECDAPEAFVPLSYTLEK